MVDAVVFLLFGSTERQSWDKEAEQDDDDDDKDDDKDNDNDDDDEDAQKRNSFVVINLNSSLSE